jgi:uncharacterized UPF0160 family protein
MTKKKVVTHNGTFHADEVVAIAVLEEMFGEVDIVRTRDEELFEGADFVVDVGGGEFDHHTKEKEYRDNKIPYASAGLVWREFGRDLIRMHGVEEDKEVENIYGAIDSSFMQGLDAIDNGVRFHQEIPIPDLSMIIKSFNPNWNSTDNEEDCFTEALKLAKVVFRNVFHGQLSVYDAKKTIKEAYDNRKQKKLLILEQSSPWQQALMEIDKKEQVLFVVFPDKRNGYRIQAVRKQPHSFEARKDLPESWAGLNGDELGAVIDIDDAIFCHPALFIAGAKSFESIMKMANMAIDN